MQQKSQRKHDMEELKHQLNVKLSVKDDIQKQNLNNIE